MAPPVAVYVVAAVVGVAAIVAFKEFVYEPHIAPRFEAWAEEFLERRRAARNRASAVSVRTPRYRDNSSSSSSSSNRNNTVQGDRGENDRALGLNGFSVEDLELEALASKEVDDWRNEVLRSQERTQDGLRQRRTNRLRDDFDGLDSSTTTLDESFTSLTHTPLALTHVISNVSSPIAFSAASLSPTPTHHLRTMAPQGDIGTLSIAPTSPTASTGSAVPTPRTSVDRVDQVDAISPSPLAAPVAIRRSSAIERVAHPLPLTPTYQVVAEDSPFGPLLPDTPRSSAEMYGERPFSPITRVMGSSAGSMSAAGSKRAFSSRADSTDSVRTLGGSGVFRKRSGLMNEVVTNDSGDSDDEENHPLASAATFTHASSGYETNGSVLSSLSERYPAPPTPPVFVSPPTSSIGIISAPSSPRSGGSEVVVHHDTTSQAPHSPSLPQTRSSLPILQLPSDLLDAPNILSRPRSSAYSATSPALSYASFLSPMPISRAVSESEGDEFLSVASDDSDWSGSPVTLSRRMGPTHDRVNNPFLDFEHPMQEVRRGGSELRAGSEGSEVLISDLGQEAGSEAGSDESWGSARRH